MAMNGNKNKKRNKKAKSEDVMQTESVETNVEVSPNEAEASELEALDVEQAATEAIDDGTVEAISPELQAALLKQEEYLAMAQRVQADFENFRRRNQGVRKESFDDGAVAFATTLLPVLDNLERALSAAKETTDETLKEGVEMVHRQLCEAFEKRGITVIDRKGEPFDPALENAVMQGTAEDGEPGTVCEVFQKGYKLEERVLRHAMVKVVSE